LYDRPRPGKVLLDGQQRQRIVALVCGPPPEPSALDGTSAGEEAVKRKLVPRVGRETIRVLLESHDLKPWWKKMWCVAALDEKYLRRMEEVLAVYEKPLSPAGTGRLCGRETSGSPSTDSSSLGHEAGTGGEAGWRISSLWNGQRVLWGRAKGGMVLPQDDGQSLLPRVC
jgi:hypothetical protein